MYYVKFLFLDVVEIRFELRKLTNINVRTDNKRFYRILS